MTVGWPTIRVFISSTFRDMHAERDHLLRIRFPELAERLRARHLHLVPVDLRWGVTEEQDALEICLEEIDTCRPRFIGILGGRYGWVPPGRDRSITAAEIAHGVLEHPEQARYAFFYFRDPAATAAIGGPEAAEYREPDGAPTRHRLEALKHDILDAMLRQAGRNDLVTDRAAPPEQRIERLTGAGVPLPVRVYPCRWEPGRGVVDLEVFGQQVLDDLWRSIEDEFPGGPSAAADPIGEEREALDFFVQTRTRFFVGRTDPLERIAAFVRERGRPGALVIIGSPGSGKSALLAQALVRFGESGEFLVLGHFAGMSTRSGSSYWILRRFVHELQSAMGMSGEIPVERAALQERLADLLQRAAVRRRVVILLDALDQLDAEARYLTWLPAALPDGVRVVASLAEDADPATGFALHRRFEAAELTLGPLAPGESARIVERVLGDQRRTLNASQTAALLSHPGAGNPLYLTVALGELAASARFETLTEEIRALAPDVPGLFQAFLQRIEADHGRELVEACGTALAVARAGLTQPELLHLLQPAPDRPLAPMQWTRLRRALAPYLTERGELLDFFHRQLREAVIGRYLPDAASRRRAHGRVADAFIALGWQYQRTLVNLTAHLADAGRDADLIALMDGEFPDTKVATTGSVAELAADYDLALAACARTQDLVHALRFTLNRSRLSLVADWICEPGAARAISALAAAQPGTEELRRAEAVVQDLIPDPGRRTLAWSELASLLPAGDDRERLLLRADQARRAAGDTVESARGDRIEADRAASEARTPLAEEALRAAAAEVAGTDRGCERVVRGLRRRWVARLLTPEERRALGVFLGRRCAGARLERVRDPMVLRAAAQEVEPGAAAVLLDPLLGVRDAEELRATAVTATAIGHAGLLARAVAAWRSTVAGATEYEWLSRFQRRRQRELLMMAGAGAWLAPVFIGGTLGIIRLFRSLPAESAGLPLAGQIGLGLAASVIGLLLAGFLWTMLLHGLLDLLGRTRPRMLAQLMTWLAPPAGERVARGMRRWLADPLVGVALLLDRLGNLGGPAGWPWSRQGRLAALAPHLRWLPPGPTAARLVREAFAMACQEPRVRILGAVMEAAAVVMPQEVAAMGRQACARLVADEAQASSDPSMAEQRRAEVDIQWQGVAGAVAAEDVVEGVGLLRQRLRPESEEGRFGLRAGFVTTALRVAGRRGMADRVAFELLGWLREEPPSGVGRALWSLVAAESVAESLPGDQVRAARAVAATRVPVWIPVAAVAVAAFAGIVGLRYYLMTRWDWPLWTARFAGGPWTVPVDLLIEAAFLTYALTVAGIVVIGGSMLFWHLFRRLLRFLARPLVRGWLRRALAPSR